MPFESTLQSLRSWMVSSCETLSIILNQGVYPEEAHHELLSSEDIGYKSWTGVVFPVSLFGGVEGEFSLMLERQRAATLIDLLVQEAIPLKSSPLCTRACCRKPSSNWWPGFRTC